MLSFADAISAIRKSVYGRDNRFPIRDALLDTMLVTKTVDQNYKDLEARIAELESKVPSDNDPPLKETVMSLFDSSEYAIGGDTWKDKMGYKDMKIYHKDLIIQDTTPGWLNFQYSDAAATAAYGIWSDTNALIETAYMIVRATGYWDDYHPNRFLCAGRGNAAGCGFGATGKTVPNFGRSSVFGVLDDSNVYQANYNNLILTKDMHVYAMTIYPSPASGWRRCSYYVDGALYLVKDANQTARTNIHIMGIHHGGGITNEYDLENPVMNDGDCGQRNAFIRCVMLCDTVHTDEQVKTVSDWLLKMYGT